MSSYGIWLAFTVLCLSPSALAAGASVPSGSGPAGPLPRYLRSALDDEPAPLTPPEPRRIRSYLEDERQASFPVEPQGRLIRISLDDDDARFGHLRPLPSRARRIRTELP